jgi:ubiquinone biosynthesis monooxygenase Coq7
MRHPSPLDRLLGQAGRLLQGLSGTSGASATTGAAEVASRQDTAWPLAAFAEPSPSPSPTSAEPVSANWAVIDQAAAAGASPGVELGAEEARHSAALMRVNHVGEVCAQALYQGQAATARSEELRRFLLGAAAEERRHLDWTRERIDQLSGRPSRLVPFWYLSSYALGFAAGLAGDRVSLGFMAETERQVEAHLAGHLDSLPESDRRSRQIVEVMQAEEVGHAREALARGGQLPPWPVRTLMRAMARVMTTTAYRI